MGTKNFNFQVELQTQVPKFNAPFLGSTKTAEIWNSRAWMIGLTGNFIVKLVSSILIFNYRFLWKLEHVWLEVLDAVLKKI